MNTRPVPTLPVLPAAARPATPREAHALLTAPGAPFEVVEDDILDSRMRVFKDRARSLRAYLYDSAAYGDAVCLIQDERRVTFAEHARAVASLAHELHHELGIGKGDRVAILAANSVEWIETFWATVSLGAVAVTMNSLWSAREVAFALDHSEPAVVVADAARRALLPASLTSHVLSVEDDVPAATLRHRRAEPGAFDEADAVEVAEDDLAVLVYTSGTSGSPKAVMHSHRNVITAVDFMRFNDETVRALGLAPPATRKFLLMTPLFHISGLHNLVVPRLALGDAVVVYAGRFDIDRILALVERERITNWIGSPTTLHRLAACRDIGRYDLSSLTAINVGSASTPPALVERVSELLPVLRRTLATTYGQTESSTAATFALPSEREEYPDSVGIPTPNMDVEIRDAHGVRVPDGVEGEIHLRGPHVMLGYWRNDAANRAAFAPDRWLRTGDIGVVQDGHLRMTTRRSDLILRGGENVLPMEVEACLAEHDLVVEAAVFGVPDADLGEQVVAVVVHDSLRPVTEEALADFLAPRLARYKIPAAWRITAEPLARNASDKVVRKELAASWDAHG